MNLSLAKHRYLSFLKLDIICRLLCFDKSVCVYVSRFQQIYAFILQFEKYRHKRDNNSQWMFFKITAKLKIDNCVNSCVELSDSDIYYFSYICMYILSNEWHNCVFVTCIKQFILVMQTPFVIKHPFIGILQYLPFSAITNLIHKRIIVFNYISVHSVTDVKPDFILLLHLFKKVNKNITV